MSDDETKRFSKALSRVFEPLAEVLIARGTTIASMTEILKRALFNAATQKTGRTSISDSQISLLTGLHRKDVRRFRELEVEPPKRSLLNPASRLIATWTTDLDFLDARGHPLRLARTTDAGPNFDALVRRSRIDLPSATMLAHLREQNLIEKTSTGDFHLLASAYVPTPKSKEQLFAFEKNLAAHVLAASRNLIAEDSHPFLERASHFNRLSDDSIAKLDELVRELGQDGLTRFNAEAARLQKIDSLNAGNKKRITFGVYAVSVDTSKTSKNN